MQLPLIRDLPRLTERAQVDIVATLQRCSSNRFTLTSYWNHWRYKDGGVGGSKSLASSCDFGGGDTNCVTLIARGRPVGRVAANVRWSISGTGSAPGPRNVGSVVRIGAVLAQRMSPLPPVPGDGVMSTYSWAAEIEGRPLSTPRLRAGNRTGTNRDPSSCASYARKPPEW